MSGLFETLSGAEGIRAAGKSAQNIAEFNAQAAEQEAEAAKIESAFEQERQAKEAEKIKSATRAAIGAVGGLGSPVAIDIAKEEAEELALEQLLIGFGGEVAAQRARTQATLDRLQGQLARQKSKSAARAANIQFGLQLGTAAFLTGFGGGGATPAATPGASPLSGFAAPRTSNIGLVPQF